MKKPRSKTGAAVFEFIDDFPFDFSPTFSCGDAGMAWHFEMTNFRWEAIAALCKEGFSFLTPGTEFFLACSPIERTIIAYNRGDVSIFEPLRIEDAARFMKSMRCLPKELQQFFDAPKSSNPGR